MGTKKGIIILYTLSTLTCIWAIIMLSGGLSISSGSEHYIGEVVIESEEQLQELTSTINASLIKGPMNLWKHGYSIREIDNGVRILDYGFFSKNGTLPFKREE